MLVQSYFERLNKPFISHCKRQFKFDAYVSEQIVNDKGLVQNVFSVKTIDLSNKPVKVSDYKLSNLLKVGFLNNANVVSCFQNSMNIVDSIKD